MLTDVIEEENDWPALGRPCCAFVEECTLEAWGEKIGTLRARQWGVQFVDGKLERPMPHRSASELRRHTSADRNDPPDAGESAIDLTRLKICFIVGHLQPGGSERQLFYILKAL